jgi:hypothetical protein
VTSDLWFSIYEPKWASIIFYAFYVSTFPSSPANRLMHGTCAHHFEYFEWLTGVSTNRKKSELIRIFNTSAPGLRARSFVYGS